MEEKKKIKVSLKTAVILVIILIMIIAAFVALMININKRKMVNNTLVATNPNGYEKNKFKGYVSYTKINEKTRGEVFIIKMLFKQRKQLMTSWKWLHMKNIKI